MAVLSASGASSQTRPDRGSQEDRRTGYMPDAVTVHMEWQWVAVGVAMALGEPSGIRRRRISRQPTCVHATYMGCVDVDAWMRWLSYKDTKQTNTRF